MIMPVMNEPEFQKILHKNNFCTVPFIFLTAKNEINLTRKCFNAGADDFIFFFR